MESNQNLLKIAGHTQANSPNKKHPQATTTPPLLNPVLWG